MSNIIKRFSKIFMMFFLLFTITSTIRVNASSDDMFRYVTDVTVLDGQGTTPPNGGFGWQKDPYDLNRGCGGAYLYLWKYRLPFKKPITGFYIMNTNGTAPNGHVKINVDLNKGSGGDYIYLCYTREEGLDDPYSNSKTSPITDVKIVGGSSFTDAKRKVPSGYTLIPSDLNKNAGGDYIYLCYKR